MVHQYKLNGYNIVLDTCSGSIHSVDDLAYDVIGMIREYTQGDIIDAMLEKYDARLNIEELQASETNFINTCREAADIAKAVGHPRVGVLCDFYHMTMGGETAADVPDFAKQVGHVHLASPTSSRSIPYETDGDDEAYRALLKALAENGFDGRFSAEGGVAGDRDFAAALKECYTYMKALLMPYEGKKA